MAKRVAGIVLLALPILAGGLWLASGREVFTKSAKAVRVPVRDELFGETFIQEQMVRGPVLGYYVGVDLVALVTVICLIAWGVVWVLDRRSRSSARRSIP